MGLTLIDPAKYRRLVSRALPKKIETGEEFDRVVERLELLDRIENPSTEEQALIALLALLVEDYDTRYHPSPGVTGGEALAYLMEANNLRAADLADIMPRSRVSEVLAGRRAISREQAKKLGKRFKVTADLFL